MLDATIENACKLFQEIWNVDEDDTPSPVSQMTGAFADRLSNLGVVLAYAVLVGYAAWALYKAIPPAMITQYGSYAQHFWFLVAVTFVVIAALRFGLDVTRTLRRWRLTNLLGALLLFDCLFKNAPKLFGQPGFSPVDLVLGSNRETSLWGLIEKAFGF